MLRKVAYTYFHSLEMSWLKATLMVPLLMCAANILSAAEWKPISTDELTLKKPRVDANADAEALFLDISLSDSAVNNQYPSTVYTFYVRMKIFTDRGVERYGTVDIPYARKVNVSNVAGRTIDADGAIHELGRDAIFDHVAEKTKGFKQHVVSLAMPGIKPGCIIEYRWRESHDEELANYVRLDVQREFPIERVVYHIKPLVTPYFPYQMQYLPFNVKLPPFQPESNGFFVSTVANVPAFTLERDLPPVYNIRPWVLIYYDEAKKETPDKYWKAEGKRLYGEWKPQIKANGEAKALAAEVTAGASSDEEKVKKLYLYCQKKIKDVSGPDVTEADRLGFKGNRNSADTLSRGIGTPMDIQVAFAALVSAAGYEARIAYLPDRQYMLFRKELTSPYYLGSRDVAVNLNGSWKLYDISTKYLEPGRVRWQEEGELALITDDKEPE